MKGAVVLALTWAELGWAWGRVQWFVNCVSSQNVFSLTGS